MKLGSEKNFVPIDVANPGDKRLVQKQSFQLGSSPFKKREKIGISDFQGFGPEPAQAFSAERLSPGEARNKSEFPDISEAQLLGIILERKDEMCMSVNRLTGI